MKLKPAEREDVRMMFGGRCAYCGCELPEKRWHVDHVEPMVRWRVRNSGRVIKQGCHAPENDRKDNLWPSCLACNINKSSSSLEVWRQFLIDGPESLAAYNGRFKHMLRFKVVTVNPEPLKFWFEIYTQ